MVESLFLSAYVGSSFCIGFHVCNLLEVVAQQQLGALDVVCFVRVSVFLCVCLLRVTMLARQLRKIEMTLLEE